MDGETAYADIELATTEGTDLERISAELTSAAPRAMPVGVETSFGGWMFQEFEMPASELFGLAAALVILVLAFGSVVAAGLPIITAVVGVGIGTAGVGL
ncbi:MAG: MMPL family transporter [Ilumatobacteraceae bacterium]